MSDHANTSAFIEAFELGFTVKRVDTRTDGLDSGWSKGSSHWRYEFRTARNDKVLRGFFTQGSALTEAPTDVDVLEGLSLDAATFRDHEDAFLLAHEWGIDLNDPAAYKRVHRAYNACGEAQEELTELLGADGVEDLWNTPPDDA